MPVFPWMVTKWLSLWIYIHMCVCMCVWMHVYTHIYTYKYVNLCWFKWAMVKGERFEATVGHKVSIFFYPYLCIPTTHLQLIRFGSPHKERERERGRRMVRVQVNGGANKWSVWAFYHTTSLSVRASSRAGILLARVDV